MAPFHQVWPDSCDIGLTLVNPTTDKPEATFVVVKEDRFEGDLLAMHLEPTKETLRKHPALKGVRMILFND